MNKPVRDKIEPIAIIGMSCRFPQADNPESFWQALRSGVNLGSKIPQERWDMNKYYSSEPNIPGKMPVNSGYFLTGIDQFDPDFFRISPREAVAIDPQHRLLLEVSWEALERAGHTPERLAGSPTGVFIGLTCEDYNDIIQKRPPALNQEHELFFVTGVKSYAASGRIAYTFGFTGPALTIDTACSASSVSVHQACLSLRQGECDMALAGGVNLLLDPVVHVYTYKGKILTTDSHCKVFDASADGYVRAEGCGIVVLKRLSDALEDKDNILAVIRGSGVNQDGASNSFSAPNGQSQQALLRRVLAQTGIDPSEVQYFEAHGTGTSLGDATELSTIEQVFGQSHSKDNPIFVGSCKANIGHPEPASGIASLIKLVSALQNQEIPPQINIKKINPSLDWEKTSVKIPTQLTPWPKAERHIGALNCFGISGTNSCMIVEEAPKSKPETSQWERPEQILVLSAKSSVALKQLADRYCCHLNAHPEQALTNICFTANTGRGHFDHRLSVTGASSKEIAAKLALFHQDDRASDILSNQVEDTESLGIAFLFTGQGSQYVEMGRQLYETQPTFRKTIERCDEILRSYQEKSLLEVLYPPVGEYSPLDETAYTQPALFAIEYALYRLWQSWGIHPAVVMGHSLGEYVAACVAGVFSLEDALKLVAARGQMMQQLPEGGVMVSLMSSQKVVTKVIQKYAGEITIAAINGPESIVISGEEKAVKAAMVEFEAEGIKTKQLQVSHAFHSPLMKPIIDSFKQVAETITYSLPKIESISNVTGKVATAEVATPEYWCRHILSPVRFESGMKTIQRLGYEIFLECGPKPILLSMGRQCLPRQAGNWLPSLRSKQSDWQCLLQTLGQLYIRGVKVDWSGFDRDYPRRKIVLPTYPFQRNSYWLETESDHNHQLLSASNQAQKPIVHNHQNNGKFTPITPSKINSMNRKQVFPKLIDVLEKQRQELIEILLEEPDTLEVYSEAPRENPQKNGEEYQYLKKIDERIPEIYPVIPVPPSTILQQLRSANGESRQLFANYIQALVAKLLGRPKEQIDMNKSLTNLGLESLLIIEFQEKVERELQLKVDSKPLLHNINLNQFVDELLDRLTVIK